MDIKIFAQQDASTEFSYLLEDIRKAIRAKPYEYILNVDVDEWRTHFLTKYDYPPIEVFSEQATVEFHSKGKSKKEQYGRTFDIETYSFEFKVPFSGWHMLFWMKPSHCRLIHPTVNVPQKDSGFLTSIFTLYEQNTTQFEYEKKRLIEGVTANVDNINADLLTFKGKISRTFDQEYENQKKKALSENDFFEKLNIPVNKNTEVIFKVPEISKKKVPEPIVDKKTDKKFVEVPSMDDKFYLDVLTILYQFFKSVEKKPSVYKPKDEQALRDYVLPILETRYESSTVTGETFNKGGKTDILIKHKDNTNLFVAECKFWTGEIGMMDTINQLFDRYLTWRDSKAAIIFFVTNKEFSKVLKTIQDSIGKHVYFVRENGNHGESSFSYILHFPLDKGKFVYLEVMAFHFPET
jgi:hypothetical protein